eukprot:991669-Pyramimonas_sp.AAC.1
MRASWGLPPSLGAHLLLHTGFRWRTRRRRASSAGFRRPSTEEEMTTSSILDGKALCRTWDA